MPERHYSLMRHLERDSQYRPTGKGREDTKAKAKEVASEIQSMPPGAVTVIVPSILERNVLTREILDEGLRDSLQRDESIEFLSVTDRDAIKRAKDNFSKRFVITDLAPQSLLGYRENNQALPGFRELLEALEGNEELAGKVWLAAEGELDGLKEEIKTHVSHIDTEKLNPAIMMLTPEEFAMNYVRFLKRIHELLIQYFPRQSSKVINITHDYYTSFTTLALIGKELNLKNLDESGGTFQKFLETSEIEFKDDKIIVTYRGQTVTIKKDFEGVLGELKEKSEQRKIWWLAGNVKTAQGLGNKSSE